MSENFTDTMILFEKSYWFTVSESCDQLGNNLFNLLKCVGEEDGKSTASIGHQIRVLYLLSAVFGRMAYQNIRYVRNKMDSLLLRKCEQFIVVYVVF